MVGLGDSHQGKGTLLGERVWGLYRRGSGPTPPEAKGAGLGAMPHDVTSPDCL